MPKKCSELVVTQCRYCGDNIASTPYRISIGAGKYCNRQCRFADMKGKPAYNKGIPNPRWQGNNNPKWHSGKKINKGYVLISIDGMWVAEHRYVAEQIIGRKLRTEEEVHHLDGDKANNSPNNLELFATHSEHVSKYHQMNGFKTWFQKGHVPANRKVAA